MYNVRNSQKEQSMPKSVDEMAATLVKNLEAQTGKSIDEWVKIARDSGETKHMKMLKYLQANYDLTYGYANTIASLAREPEGEAPKTGDDLVEAQYSQKANLRPIYDAIIDAVEGFGDDIEISPKKMYVSLRRSKQFALVQPSTKTRVDVGIKIKDFEPTGRLETAGSWNSMVTHRVRVTDVDQVNDELIAWLRKGYSKA
jgi:hypothetical protein